MIYPTSGHAGAPRTLQFGAAAASGGSTTQPLQAMQGQVQWLLKRNCSATPRQVVVFFASLCVIATAIGAFFWSHGAVLVMPFAWLEVAAIGAALWVYARHATDQERIHLQGDRLTVEHVSGRRVECVEFAPAWVRVEPHHGERSLIELSGQGRRISVGRFVRPESRRLLADELRWVLRRWQGPLNTIDALAGLDMKASESAATTADRGADTSADAPSPTANPKP